jgi:hypothetical protein
MVIVVAWRPLSLTSFCRMPFHRPRIDIQHNDIQCNDTQHIEIQHNDIQHFEIQHNDIQHNEVKHNDI